MLNIQFFYKFLSRLSKRERMVFFGAISFVSLMLLDRLVISPVFSKISELNEQIQEKESDIKKNLRILAYKDRILQETKKYASFLASAKSEEEEMVSLLKEIEGLASESSVYLIDMKPAGLKDSGSSGRYVINLNCEAQMEQIVSFMYAVENSNKLLSIEKYRISPKSNESSVAKCSMSIYKIIMP